MLARAMAPGAQRGPSGSWQAWGLLVAMLVAPVLLLLTPSAAHATETTVCTGSDTNACLTGTLRTEADVVGGVDLVITTPAGTEETVTTDEAGKWSFQADESGSYEVALDEESLPDGVGAPGETTRQVEVMIGPDVKQKTFVALFELRTGDYEAGGASKVDQLVNGAISGLKLGLLLALASLGLSLIYGTTGLSNFAHAEQVTLGGVVAYLLVSAQQLGLNLWLGIVLTVVICAATGYLQDLLMWKPLRRRGLGLTQMMIVTIGMSLAAQYAFQFFIGSSTEKVTLQAFPDFTLGPLNFIQLVAMGISIVAIVLVGYVLIFTRVGQATRAVSDNPALASASGIDVDRIIRLVWTASAGLAGLSGVLYALAVSNGIRWDTGMQILLLLFAAVTLGGLGTAFGAFVGSLVIGLVVSLAGPLGAPGDLKYAVALGLLIVILVFRPQGLLGRAGRVG